MNVLKEAKRQGGYSWWGVGKVEPGPELFFLDPGPGSTFCIEGFT